MKRAYTVLAALLMAATTFSQDSRRTASTNSSARTRAYESTTPTRSSTKTNRVVVNNGSQKVNANSTQQSGRSVASRNNNYNSNTVHKHPSTRSTNRTYDNYKRPERSVNTRSGTYAHNTEKQRHHTGHSHASQHNQGYTSTRVYRGHHKSSHVYHHAPHSREYRAKHYVYREPVHLRVVWTRDMHRHYISMYPSVRHWEYRYGYRVASVSAYYADYYVGDVKTVYGKVKEVFYSYESDEYFLHMGAYYPYHDFTIVLPGDLARRYSARPIRYFTNEFVNVTGLITSFDGKPEIVVKRKFQLDVY